MIKSCLLIVCLSAFTASTVLAQQKTSAPLPIQPAGDSLGLQVTVNLVPDDLNSAPAVRYVAAVRDNIRSQDLTSGVVKEEIPAAANSRSVKNNLSPTMTVKTTTLLELHAMRQSAVDLCIQLPTKYRTRLPQCAEIFKHEIRLETFAKENHSAREKIETFPNFEGAPRSLRLFARGGCKRHHIFG